MPSCFAGTMETPWRRNFLFEGCLGHIIIQIVSQEIQKYDFSEIEQCFLNTRTFLKRNMGGGGGLINIATSPKFVKVAWSRGYITKAIYNLLIFTRYIIDMTHCSSDPGSCKIHYKCIIYNCKMSQLSRRSDLSFYKYSEMINV